MKILKLKDEVFYYFASKKINFNPEIDEYELIRNTDGVCLKIYYGGEVEDVRMFYFKDYECRFLNGRLQEVEKCNAMWVKFVVRYTDLCFDAGYINKWNALVRAKIDETVSSLNEDLIP